MLISDAYERAEVFLKYNFHQFLTEYWENTRMDLNKYKSLDILNPNEAFNLTLEFLKNQKDRWENQIPIMAEIGLLFLDF